MKTNRRRFLTLALLASTAAGAIGLFKRFFSSPNNKDVLAAVGVYLDTLLPAYHGPSATQLGVEKKIMAKAQRNRDYRRLLERGVDWLNTQAGTFGDTGFAALAEEQREQILARGANAPANTVARRFFERMRSDAFSFFYTDRRSWVELGYHGPPQPVGFMDHASAPEDLD